jgi:hypothetical protein
MKPEESMALFHNGELQFRPLLRELIGHNGWIIPASEEDEERPVLWRMDGKLWLLAFSSDETFKEYLDDESASRAQTVDGRWLFSSLSPPIDGVVLDAGKTHGTQFDSEKFDYLRIWAQGLKVERILSGAAGEDGFPFLREFEGYRLPVVQSESGKAHIALAPDAQGRKLAAVFTAEDCLEAFLKDAQGAYGEGLLVDTLDGAKLFEQLKALPLDGVVFNCSGPAKPRAVTLQMVIELAAKEP